MKPTLESRITAVFDDYRATTALLEDFAKKCRHSNELVILACARLDALANLAMTQEKTQRERFVSFLRTYSTRRNELEQVTVSNIYFQMSLRFITLSETFPALGRMYARDLMRDAAFLQFVVDSGIPITENDVSEFLHRLSVWLQRKYRTTASQAKSKPYLESKKNAALYLEACSQSF